jgi:Uma2 family endonuclease
VTPNVTTTELLTSPGLKRELIRGELRERDSAPRHRRHAATESRIVQALGNWRDEVNFEADVLSGDVGSILSRDPGTTMGIDVTLFSLEVLRRQTDERFVTGTPILAVEILSPGDTHEVMREKINEYHRTGVRMIWVVDPDFRTVLVYPRNDEPIMYNRRQKLTGGDVLPGFAVLVEKLFPSW